MILVKYMARRSMRMLPTLGEYVHLLFATYAHVCSRMVAHGDVW
jgi:hypothetical protein